MKTVNNMNCHKHFRILRSKAIVVKISIAAIVILSAVCQGRAQQSKEKKLYLELQSRAEFMEVDTRHQPQGDTIFYSRSGFLIYPEWAFRSDSTGAYYIIEYPEYTLGKQEQKQLARKYTKEALVKTGNPVNFPIANTHGKKLLRIPQENFDAIPKDTIFHVGWRPASFFANTKITTGQLTVPFKLRPARRDKKFQMTTDVTIGTYAGFRKRISKREPIYVTIPATLGLTFINVNNNTTTDTGSTEKDAGVVPGWSWSTGAVFQFNGLNVGVVLGRDYASGVAEDWIYHNKTWYSFAIGYSFVK